MNKNLDLRLNFVPLSCHLPVILPEELNRLLILAVLLACSLPPSLCLYFFRVLQIHILTFIPFRFTGAWSSCLLFLSVVQFFLFELLCSLFLASFFLSHFLVLLLPILFLLHAIIFFIRVIFYQFRSVREREAL